MERTGMLGTSNLSSIGARLDVGSTTVFDLYIGNGSTVDSLSYNAFSTVSVQTGVPFYVVLNSRADSVRYASYPAALK